MTKQAVFAALRERGADRAVVHFEGGGDEGGCDSIEFFEGHASLGTHPVDEDELGEALCQPVYDEYGSFAGDFTVNGEVIWDAKTGKVTMSYDESVPTSTHYEEEVLT